MAKRIVLFENAAGGFIWGSFVCVWRLGNDNLCFGEMFSNLCKTFLSHRTVQVVQFSMKTILLFFKFAITKPKGQRGSEQQWAIGIKINLRDGARKTKWRQWKISIHGCITAVSLQPNTSKYMEGGAAFWTFGVAVTLQWGEGVCLCSCPPSQLSLNVHCRNKHYVYVCYRQMESRGERQWCQLVPLWFLSAAGYEVCKINTQFE